MKEYAKDWPEIVVTQPKGAIPDFRVALLDRENERYAATKTRLDGQAAHIMPRTPTAIKSPKGSCFWFLVGVVFGGEFRKKLWGLCGGRRVDMAYNGMLLQATLHFGWDRLRFSLSPSSAQREGPYTRKFA